MGDDQAITGEAILGQPVLVEDHVLEGLDEIAVAARRNGEDELQRSPALLGQGCEGADIVEAQQPAVGHQDHALYGEALQNGGQHGLQGLGLGHVARMHGMHERQPLGGLYDAEDELAGDSTGLLVHAKGAYVLLDLRFTVDAHGGQVVEDDGQVTVDQGADLFGQLGLHPVYIVHERVHGAQEVVMFDLGRHLGHGHGVDPAQAAQLAGWIAKAVEDHGPHQSICFDLAPPRTHCAPEGAAEAEIRP
jgi:hypothetical protein